MLANCYNLTWESGLNITQLRDSEQTLVATGPNYEYVAVYDIRASSKLSSGLSIANTIFVCFILAGGALLFTTQVNDLVINPIEQMILKVTKISENPLIAA